MLACVATLGGPARGVVTTPADHFTPAFREASVPTQSTSAPSDLPVTPGVEYREAVGFLGYCVGDDGSVWSQLQSPHSRRSGWHRIGDTAVNKKRPYPLVCLRADGKARFVFVHQLVLTAFVGPCPPGLVCRHLDGNGQNNRLGNICWGTEAENAEDRRRHGTLILGSKHKLAKLTEEYIPDIKAAVAAGITQTQIADSYGVHPSIISRIVAGKKWKHVRTRPSEEPNE